MAIGVTSSWWLATSGIHQGSVFRSVLLKIFINEVDEEKKCPFPQFANSAGLGRSVYLLEGRKGLQGHLERLDQWNEVSCMRFKKAK